MACWATALRDGDRETDDVEVEGKKVTIHGSAPPRRVLAQPLQTRPNTHPALPIDAAVCNSCSSLDVGIFSERRPYNDPGYEEGSDAEAIALSSCRLSSLIEVRIRLFAIDCPPAECAELHFRDLPASRTYGAW
jgi:hypothetical protein